MWFVCVVGVFVCVVGACVWFVCMVFVFGLCGVVCVKLKTCVFNSLFSNSNLFFKPYV